MEKFTARRRDMRSAMVTQMTRKTSPRNAACTRLRSDLMRSLLREGFQTIYAEIMVARGHLAVMLDGREPEPAKSMTTKLMGLNHQLDAILLESEAILASYPDTRD